MLMQHGLVVRRAVRAALSGLTGQVGWHMFGVGVVFSLCSPGWGYVLQTLFSFASDYRTHTVSLHCFLFFAVTCH